MRLSLLIILFLINLIWSAASADMREDLPNKKAWALQYSIENNFRFGSFQGQTLSLLKHTSINRAWRIGLTASIFFENAEISYRSGNNDKESSWEITYDVPVSLEVIRVYYPNFRSKINWFYGWGPLLSYKFHKTESSGLPRYLNTMRSFEWDVGLVALVGVQWFPGKSIGLNAEYTSNLAFRFTRSVNDNLSWTMDGEYYMFNRGRKETHGIHLSASAVKIGISAYF